MATWRFCDGAVTNFTLPMKDEPANKKGLKSRGNSSMAVKSRRKGSGEWGRNEDRFKSSICIGKRSSTLNNSRL